MTEEWRTISINENYEVSSFGNVRRKELFIEQKSRWGIQKRKIKERNIKVNINKGYRVVCLSNKKSSTFKVARLVAITFISNENTLKNQVNHIDGNKLNDNVSNLEWVTAKENYNHALRTGLCHIRKGQNHHWSKLRNKDVVEIRHINPKKHVEQINLAEKYGIHVNTLRDVVLMKTWVSI